MTEDQVFMPVATAEQIQWFIEKHRDLIAANNEKFCEVFGDFQSVRAKGCQMGSSPDGRYFGFRFNIEGQGRIHVALPVEMWGVFVNELVALMNVAGERFATAFGEPGGNA
jgi:hypothetical protein